MNEVELNEYKKKYIEHKNNVLQTQKILSEMNEVLRQNGLFYNPWRDKFQPLVDGEMVFLP